MAFQVVSKNYFDTGIFFKISILPSFCVCPDISSSNLTEILILLSLGKSIIIALLLKASSSL